jgi:two-component system, NtrC family, sensor kinase
MALWTGITRRLVAGFGLLVVLLGIASAVALSGIDQVRTSMHEVRRLEDRMRAVLLLSSAVRDQYAHQAHMILLGDDSHMGMYETSLSRVHDLTNEIVPWIEDPNSQYWLCEIERSSFEIDRLFRDDILPAVLLGDRTRAEAVHDEALALVLDVQGLADRVAEHMEASIAGFEANAAGAHRRTYRNALVLLLGATGFAAATGLWIGRSVARPVAQLQAGAARLAAGDLKTRIEVASDDELGRLAAQFNAMTEALEEHQTERARAERLAGVGRLAAGVAHEINNPLGVILGYTRLLQKKAAALHEEGEGIGEDLAVIEEETERCKAIVEDLLHLARPIDPGADPVDLRELCEQAADRLVESGFGRGTTVTVAGSASAVGSGRALHQVMVNLLRNAMEATGEDGRVRVHLHENGDGVRVEVEDDGPGLTEEARGRLFEPFFTTKATGTGLGLAVSRAIVEAHHGRLEAEEDAGRGARFVVRLPAGEAGRGS